MRPVNRKKFSRFLARKQERGMHVLLDAAGFEEVRMRLRARGFRRASARNVQRHLVLMAKRLQSQKESKAWAAAVKWVNRRLATLAGLAAYDGEFECPRCGQVIPMMADPDEWQRDGNRWKVTGFWPGMGDCEECNVFFSDDPWNGCVRLYENKA